MKKPLFILLMNVLMLLSSAFSKTLKIFQITGDQTNPSLIQNIFGKKEKIAHNYDLGMHMNSTIQGQYPNNPKLNLTNMIVFSDDSIISLEYVISYIAGVINNKAYLAPLEVYTVFNSDPISNANDDDALDTSEYNEFIFNLEGNTSSKVIIRLLNNSLLLQSNAFKCPTKQNVISKIKHELILQDSTHDANFSCQAYVNKILEKLNTKTGSEFELSNLYELTINYVNKKINNYNLSAPEMETLAECLSYYMMKVYLNDKELIRLNTGYLIYHILNEMQASRKDIMGDTLGNVYVYYSNRVNIETILMALHIDEKTNVYAENENLSNHSYVNLFLTVFNVKNLIIELEKNETLGEKEIDEQYFVKITTSSPIHKNNSKPLFIIPYNKFIRALTKYVIRDYDDYEYFCFAQTTITNKVKQIDLETIKISYIFITLTCILILISVCFCMYKKKIKKIEYAVISETNT